MAVALGGLRGRGQHPGRAAKNRPGFGVEKG